MRKDKLLMTPGPTMLPPEVLAASSKQIIHHRTKEFGAIFTRVNEKLKQVFSTTQPVMTLTGSGTAGMEAAVVNCFSPGDQVIVASIGSFGDRFKKITTTYGLDVIPYDVPWGQAVDVATLKAMIADHPNLKGVFITHNETSTGVMNDIQAVAALTKNTDILLIVDSVSAMAGIPLEFDAWGVDVAIAGSQKALMIAPGIVYICLSKKAQDAMERSTFPKFYFNLKSYMKSVLDNDTPFTPAITLIIAQEAALDLILAEGMPAIYARHHKMANATRAGVKALGLKLFADEAHASDLITSVDGPEGVDVEAVRKLMNQRYNIMITGGQGHLKGRILRIGHMGYVDGFDLVKCFEALEYALAECGYKFTQGAGVAAVHAAMAE